MFGHVIAAIVVSLSLVSCSDCKNVLVSNPCSRPVVVGLSVTASPPQGEWPNPVTVAPESSRVMHWPDAGRDYLFAGVQIGTAEVQVLEVRTDGPEPIPVVVPARFC